LGYHACQGECNCEPNCECGGAGASVGVSAENGCTSRKKLDKSEATLDVVSNSSCLSATVSTVSTNSSNLRNSNTSNADESNDGNGLATLWSEADLNDAVLKTVGKPNGKFNSSASGAAGLDDNHFHCTDVTNSCQQILGVSGVISVTVIIPEHELIVFIRRLVSMSFFLQIPLDYAGFHNEC
jgi:hypothetical protein